MFSTISKRSQVFYRPTQHALNLVKEDDQALLDILHVSNYVPQSNRSNEVSRLRSNCCTKDIKYLKVQKNHGVVDKSEAKQILRLKRKIQRTGLALARHAEESALAKYQSSVGVRGRKPIARRKLIMYCVRINSIGELTESKPCSHCAEVMRNYGIRKVKYSTWEGAIITESLATIVTRPSVGYRSVERVVHILDEMMAEINNTGVT